MLHKLIKHLKKQFKKEADTLILNTTEYLINDNKFYTVSETASLLRIKVSTLYSWTYNQKIKVTKCGGKNLYSGKAIKQVLK